MIPAMVPGSDTARGAAPGRTTPRVGLEPGEVGHVSVAGRRRGHHAVRVRACRSHEGATVDGRPAGPVGAHDRTTPGDRVAVESHVGRGGRGGRGGRAGHVERHTRRGGAGRGWGRGQTAPTWVGLTSPAIGESPAQSRSRPALRSTAFQVPVRGGLSMTTRPPSRSTCSHTSGCAAAARSTSAPAHGSPRGRGAPWPAVPQRRAIGTGPAPPRRSCRASRRRTVRPRGSGAVGRAASGTNRPARLGRSCAHRCSRPGRTPRWSTPPSVTPDTFGQPRAVRPRRRPRDPSP